MDSPWWVLTLLTAVWDFLIQAQESKGVSWELGTLIVRSDFTAVALYYVVQSVVYALGGNTVSESLN